MADFRRVVRSNSAMVVELLLRAALICIFRYLEECPPFYRVIKQEELWLYRIQSQSMTLCPLTLYTYVALSQIISLGIPSAFIITHYLSTRQYVDLRQAFLTLSMTAPLNGVVIDLIKISVGRPRPDFFYRCFPDGEVTYDLQCSGPPDLVKEGRKSFPSGHSAWIFSCFGFLSLYLLGKLQCLRASGRGEGWRLCLALSPLLAAILVALSRFQDYRHHWDDIAVGGAIGWLIACMCYYHHYPPPWSPVGHAPYTPPGMAPVGAKFVTSPSEVEAACQDCELGGGGDVTPQLNGSKLSNRKV